jgi:hypothetical protein
MNLLHGLNDIPMDNELANLPYWELIIDVATTIGAIYTEDGVLIDNWNDSNNVAFQPYHNLEKHGLAPYVGCRRVVFVAQTATFCVVSATCRDTLLVMSQTQENVVSARVSK